MELTAPSMARPEAKLMMAPRPVLIISRAKAWEHRNEPTRLTASVLFHISTG